MVTPLATPVGGKICLWDLEVMDSKSRSNSRSKLLSIGICLVHPGLFYHIYPYQTYIFFLPRKNSIVSRTFEQFSGSLNKSLFRDP